MSTALQTTIIISILLVAFASIGFPLLLSENRKQQDNANNLKPMTIGEISLVFLLPFFAALTVAYMMARTAACSGWMNSSIPLGIFLLIGLMLIFIKLIPKLIRCKNDYIPFIAGIVLIITYGSIFIFGPALYSFDDVDQFHHPIFIPTDKEWVNTIILTLGKWFPMDHSYQTITFERRLYYPELSFIENFTTVLGGSMALVFTLSLVPFFNKKCRDKKI
ncbi:hypothetical protein IJU97_06575 [bacterium]|nr:hypothetical protein [bacterium]